MAVSEGSLESAALERIPLDYKDLTVVFSEEDVFTFITPTGLSEYLLMPFGLCNSPAVFQHLVNEVLQNMLGHWVFVYLLRHR